LAVERAVAQADSKKRMEENLWKGCMLVIQAGSDRGETARTNLFNRNRTVHSFRADLASKDAARLEYFSRAIRRLLWAAR
jgi:hypothetical protein